MATMTPTRRWITATCAIGLFAGLSLTGCSDDSESDPGHEHTGSDDHEHIDPVTGSPAGAAQAVATTLTTWTPANQASPFSLPGTFVEQSLTGQLEELARDPESEQAMDRRPEQWEGWAAANATVKGFVLDTETTEGSDTEATVVATVRQDLRYPDGSRSTMTETEYTVTLVAEDGHWKAERFED